MYSECVSRTLLAFLSSLFYLVYNVDRPLCPICTVQMRKQVHFPLRLLYLFLGDKQRHRDTPCLEASVLLQRQFTQEQADRYVIFATVPDKGL